MNHKLLLNLNLSSRIEKRLDFLIDKKIIENSFNYDQKQAKHSILLSAGSILAGFSIFATAISFSTPIFSETLNSNAILTSVSAMASVGISLLGIKKLCEKMTEIKKAQEAYNNNYELEYLKVQSFDSHIEKIEEFYGLSFLSEDIIKMKTVKNSEEKPNAIKNAVNNLKIKVTKNK